VAKKKKSKKKKGTQPGVDVNEQRRERLEARRRAKAEEQAARLKAERRRKLINRTALIGGLGAVAWLLFLRPPSGPTEIEGHQILSFRNFGSNEHTGSTVNYESQPPVSGPHAAQPGPCGVFSEPIPNETQVHSLEHGVIALQYNPADVPIEEIRTLESIVSEYDSHVYSAPYPDMPQPIAITSWTRMMTLDTVDASAIRKYIEEFRDNGPEGGKECDNSGNDPFEPPEPTPAPSVVPSPSPSG
jgi:Protein of unknown function (DUF3105)